MISTTYRTSFGAPLGATRAQAKEILPTHGVPFFEPCCFEPHALFSAMVQVGQEDKPWVLQRMAPQRTRGEVAGAVADTFARSEDLWQSRRGR